MIKYMHKYRHIFCATFTVVKTLVCCKKIELTVKVLAKRERRTLKSSEKDLIPTLEM